MRFRNSAVWKALFAIFLSAAAHTAQAQTDKNRETRYLAFQIFIGAADPAIAIGGTGMNALGPMPSPPALDAYVKDIITRIGTVGQGKTRLAVVFGLLAFDHSDAQVRQLIETAFSIALQHNIAVGFHIDDSMFWARRKDLWSNPDNVEWAGLAGHTHDGAKYRVGAAPGKDSAADVFQQ